MSDPAPISAWRRAIPNLLTLGNALCGFTAIIICLQAYEVFLLKGAGHGASTVLDESSDILANIFAGCAWLILFAMVFDALDGWAARKLRSTSSIGIEMDSLADMITFGLTPAVICYIYAHISQTLGLWQGWGRYDRTLWVCCAVYVSCAALRLARYNVKAWEQSMLPPAERAKEEGFTGIPSPGAASGICSIILMANSPVFVGAESLDLPAWVITVFLPCYCVILGALMVSHIPYPHVGKWLLSGKSLPRKLLVLSALLLTTAGETLYTRHAPVITAAVVITLYILSGPLLLLLRWFGQKIRAGHEEDDESPA
ncbi:MAG: hypothetical protein RL095_2694 [Verrucomicrobiota bacterium]|jgi:CDP-diacylglycerol--serine O-phosphatidyltransferase